MSLAITVDAMIAAGCTPEQIGAVVREHEAERARGNDVRLSANRTKRNGSGRLPEREWLDLCALVFERDGKACKYCGTTEGRFHVDHIVALSRGGGNSIDNLVVSCGFCNCSKGARALSEWRARS